MTNALRKLFDRWKLAGIIACGLVSCQVWHNPIQVEHFRDGQKIGTYHTKNGIVDVGINSLLDVTFRAQTPITAWYMGLVDNAGFSAFANADTMSSHAGWAEATIYSESVRQTWSPAAASGRAIANSTAVEFSINGTGVIKGIFLTSVSTKSGTTGTLWATAAFTSTVSVTNGDVLKVTYTISG
jgi:hypothetical protein